MAAYIFLDTNVLLHYQFFRDVNWGEQFSEPCVTLVFAPVVISELDSMKWAGGRRERERSKSVLRSFQELDLGAVPVDVRAGVKAMALESEPDDNFMSLHRLQPRNADDRLLASVISFQLCFGPEHRVLVVSADTGIRIKARTRKVETCSPPESLQLPNELDETERALEKARQELARSATPVLRLAADLSPDATVALFGPLAAGDRREALRDWQRDHPLLQVEPEGITLPDGMRLEMSGLNQILGKPTPRQALAHNREVAQYQVEFEAYLDNWAEILNAQHRCVEIALVLYNEGTGPADDVDLSMWTESKGVWREELPELPKLPEPPRPRNPYLLGLPPSRLESQLDLPNIRFRSDPIEGPAVHPEDPHRVCYTVKRVKHHVPCHLPKAFFQFESNADVKPFTLHYKLVAANVRHPHTGTLHLRIRKEEAGSAPPPERERAAPDEDA